MTLSRLISNCQPFIITCKPLDQRLLAALSSPKLQPDQCLLSRLISTMMPASRSIARARRSQALGWACCIFWGLLFYPAVLAGCYYPHFRALITEVPCGGSQRRVCGAGHSPCLQNSCWQESGPLGAAPTWHPAPPPSCDPIPALGTTSDAVTQPLPSLLCLMAAY